MKTKREKQTEDLLLSQYSRYYRLAYSYVHNEQDALDIVQESAYKAMRDCRSVQNDAYLGTWLYRIVINTALEFLRKNKREDTVEEVTEPLTAAVGITPMSLPSSTANGNWRKCWNTSMTERKASLYYDFLRTVNWRTSPKSQAKT